MALTSPAITASRAGPLQRLRQLPREGRDTLFLLAVIGWTVLPHLSHLPLWCSLLTGGVLLWRARLALRDAPLPGRWLLIGTLALAAGLTFWSYRSLIGQEPGITLAVLLMALKTLELRARRDAFVVFFLGFFLVLTQFLYSQSLLVAVAMLVSVWGLLTALVLAHMPVGQPALGQAGRLAAQTALLGAPIMVLLFLLFPRIGPLWGVPQEGLSTTGLSNSMRMGSVAEVALDDSVALRIRFLDRVPPREAMYFRGPVLSHFDGQEWRPLGSDRATAAATPGDLRVRGGAIRYEMTLEPLKLTVLPLLEATGTPPELEDATLRIRQRDDLRWVAQRPVFERLRFTAQAHLDFAHGPRTATAELRDHVALPPGHNPRLLAWGAALRRDPRLAEADGRTLAQAVMAHIRTQGYTYTLAPGVYGERDPMGALDEFWFDRKQGFCEHFAAGFVVAMRAMDVPARVVTGYQGTDPDPVDGYHVVRQSAAHAWAEYWQAGEGWVRADPTAAVAPDRVARSRNLAPPPGFVAGTLGTVSPQLLARFRNAWETVNNRWNQWVLNYSRNQQFDLLQRLGFDAPSWQDLALLLAGVLSTLALAGAGWAWWNRHRTDPWTRQMLRVRGLLHGLGLLAAAHEAPRTLAGRVRQQFAPRGEALAELLESLDTQRYGRAARAQPDPALSRRIRLAVRALSRPAR